MGFMKRGDAELVNVLKDTDVELDEEKARAALANAKSEVKASTESLEDTSLVTLNTVDGEVIESTKTIVTPENPEK